jgi:hypothetical protein
VGLEGYGRRCRDDRRGLGAGDMRTGYGYCRQNRSLQQAVRELGGYMLDNASMDDALTAAAFTRRCSSARDTCISTGTVRGVIR